MKRQSRHGPEVGTRRTPPRLCDCGEDHHAELRALEAEERQRPAVSIESASALAHALHELLGITEPVITERSTACPS